MKTKIDITKILGRDLKSRFAVNDLMMYIKNNGSKSFIVDFANVEFATRSFIDEYYNVIIKNNSNIEINTINIPQDVQIILDAVSRTQNRNKDIDLDATVIKCKTFADIQKVLGSLMI